MNKEIAKNFIHPFLLGIFPIISLMGNNATELRAVNGIRSLFFVLLIASCLLIVNRLIFGAWDKAAIATTFTLLPMLTYGHVYHLLKAQEGWLGSLARHRILIPVNVVFIVSFKLWLRRSHSFESLTRYLNIVSVVVLIFPLIQIAKAELVFVREDHRSRPIEDDCALKAPEGENPPDIYYIILDAYARQDVLAETYHYDNESFLQALRNRGFFVAEWSQSNYARTGISLESSLNYSYFEEFDGEYLLAAEHEDGTELSIGSNRARIELECLGYSTVAFDSGYYWSGWRNADYFLSPEESSLGNLWISRLNSFEAMLLHESAGLILTDIPIFLSQQFETQIRYPMQEHRERVIFALEETGSSVPSLPNPKFVFVHIVSPHPPYLFGPNGEEIQSNELFTLGDTPTSIKSESELYPDQVHFINSKVIDMVDGILEKSESDPIIILQGDHGIGRGKSDRMSILNAYYLPGIEYSDYLYSTITPVNTFRVVFNIYFNTQYALLKDVSYFSRYETLFDFEIVPNPHAD